MKVELIDHMGSDLSVVNAARVSFSKQSDWEEYEIYATSMDAFPVTAYRLSKGDQGLIQFLARGCSSGDWQKTLDTFRFEAYEMPECEVEDLVNHIRRMPTHWTPFAHTAISLRIKAPIFMARQFGKHQVGMVWNEVSRRYVDEDPEFFMPDAWRKRAENVKQGSSEEAVAHYLSFYKGQKLTALPEAEYDTVIWRCLKTYDEMIKGGVCPEQARMVLPQSMMTEWIWTGSLYTFANVYIQRSNSHAQKEAQELAKLIGDVVKPLFPVSWEALTKC